MKKNTLALIAVAAIGLTACGSKSESDKVKDVLNEVGTSTDKSVCTKDFTPAGRRAFEQAAGSSCASGISENAKNGEKPDVQSVNVNGNNATATIKTSGGGNVAVTLVKQNGDWKISGLK